LVYDTEGLYRRDSSNPLPIADFHSVVTNQPAAAPATVPERTLANNSDR